MIFDTVLNDSSVLETNPMICQTLSDADARSVYMAGEATVVTFDMDTGLPDYYTIHYAISEVILIDINYRLKI